VVRVPGYITEMYCVSCEVRTEFICYVEESRRSLPLVSVIRQLKAVTLVSVTIQLKAVTPSCLCNKTAEGGHSLLSL
jgi:hypothetical protein